MAQNHKDVALIMNLIDATHENRIRWQKNPVDKCEKGDFRTGLPYPGYVDDVIQETI
jgi:hypothetical protein